MNRLTAASDLSGDDIGALDLLRRFAKAHPDAIVLCRLAGIAKDLGETEEASVAFRQAIKLDSSLALAYVGLASMALGRDEYAGAEGHLKGIPTLRAK